MSETFEINGRSVSVDGEPTLGTVKYVQNMEMDLMQEYIDDDVLTEAEDIDEDEFFSLIMEDADFDDMKDMMWNRSLMEPLQTIVLATNTEFDPDELEDMPALKFKEVREAAEEALGGPAQDFLEELGVGTSLSRSELMEAETESETG